MSRTFVTSDGVSADALQKNEKFLLDNYILKNKTIPIELFGDNTTIAIGEAITFLTNNGGGAVHIPAQGSTFDLEIRVFKDRSGTFHTQYIYNYDRYPTVESRPYSGGDWKVGDTIINTQPTVDKCLGWVCSANGTPGTWTPFGWCKTWFSEIEQVDSLPDPSILQANRQLVYGGKVCYCMLVNGEYKWVHPVDGADGKSAYQYAQDGGYTGTEAQFNTDLAAVGDKQSRITASGLLKGDGTGGVTTATKGTDYVGASETVTATLLAASWTGDVVPYSYTLTVTGVTANSNQELLPALNITKEQLTALQAANIQDGGQAANSITLTAFGDKPTIDLPIRVIVRGDS